MHESPEHSALVETLKGQTFPAYLSGKMSGMPNHNYEKFFETEKHLRKVFPFMHLFNPANNDATQSRRTLMTIDLQAVMASDVVFVLEDWEESPGACREVTVALDLGILILRADNYQPADTSLYGCVIVRPRKDGYKSTVGGVVYKDRGKHWSQLP